MIRLALAELRDGWRSWSGALIVVTVASALLGACAIVASTWLSVRADTSRPPGVADVLAQLSIMVTGFTGVTAVVVLSSVAAVAVQSDRARYARWQLVGITPAGVRVVLSVQLISLGVIGAAVGILVASALSQPIIDLVVRAIVAASGPVSAVTAAVSPVLLAVAGVVVLVVVFVSGFSPAHRASRISPLEALRAPEAPPRAMSVSRWVLAALFLLLTVVLLATTFGNSPDIISLNTIFACITASATIAAAGPLILPPVMRLWPRILPDRMSTPWFLARTGAAHRLLYSASSVTPLLVGMTLIGSIFSAAYTQRNAMLANGVPVDRMSLANDQVVIMLGGPLLLAVAGAAAVIFQGAAERRAAATIFWRSGVSPVTIVAAAALEAVVAVGTALILALVVIVAIVSIESLALAGPVGPSLPTVEFPALLALAAVGLIVLALSSVLPVIRTARGALAR